MLLYTCISATLYNKGQSTCHSWSELGAQMFPLQRYLLARNSTFTLSCLTIFVTISFPIEYVFFFLLNSCPIHASSITREAFIHLREALSVSYSFTCKYALQHFEHTFCIWPHSTNEICICIVTPVWSCACCIRARSTNSYNGPGQALLSYRSDLLFR